jgi:hypothetical protein
MASQKFPVSKDECIKLTSTHKGSGDKNLDDWLDNHAASPTEKALVQPDGAKENIGAGVVKTKAAAISIDAISTNKEDINVQAALMAFYEGPARPTANPATGGNTSKVHDWLIADNPEATINQEVGSKISQGEDLFTLKSNINKRQSGAIIKIDAVTGGSAVVGEAGVKCGALASGITYTEDSASSADNIGDNNAADIVTRMTVGTNESIEVTATVKARKAIYVTPSATTPGRMRLVVSGRSSHTVKMAANSVSGDGKGIFHGYGGKKIEIAATSITVPVDETDVNMGSLTGKTYYLGTGYRKWFAGTINTDNPTSIKTKLAYGGCRDTDLNNGIELKGSDKMADGTIQIKPLSVTNKYFWIAIPATKEVTKIEYADDGQATNDANFIKLPGTISVYGACEQFATDYNVYVIANSNDKIVGFNLSATASGTGFFKFKISDPS